MSNVKTKALISLKNVTFIAANTDLQALDISQASIKAQSGVNISPRLGTGANREIGRQAGLESIDQIKER